MYDPNSRAVSKVAAAAFEQQSHPSATPFRCTLLQGPRDRSSVLHHEALFLELMIWVVSSSLPRAKNFSRGLIYLKTLLELEENLLQVRLKTYGSGSM
jgi:hypothetical protein